MNQIATSGSMMQPLAMSDFSVVTCLAAGRAHTIAALREGRSGLAPCAFDTLSFPTYTGEVADLDAHPLQGALAGFDCRNNRLAKLALLEDAFAESLAIARERHGAARIGVFVGTSTSGLLQTEMAYRARAPESGALPASFDYLRTHNTYSLARFVRAACDLAGPSFVVSTACAATAKVFASAARMIAAGVCDAAVDRSMLRAAEFLSVKPAASSFWNGRTSGTARTPSFCLASAKAPMPITCRRHIPRESAHGSRWRAR
jgi:3-oxoacyl-[acyl-carrier-protein] synthase-1